jgi:hypothetical protein
VLARSDVNRSQIKMGKIILRYVVQDNITIRRAGSAKRRGVFEIGLANIDQLLFRVLSRARNLLILFTGTILIPLSTDMRRLTTGKRSEKCVVRRFRRCANVIECTYTNLDSTV